MLAVLVAVSGCGAPEPPNIRQEFGKGIQRLGMTAIYPLSESARIGQVLLVDQSAEDEGDVAADIPTSVLLTNAVVPEMEKRRAALAAAANRFPCSAETLGEQVNPQLSYYRQSTCAAPASAEKKEAQPAPSQQSNIYIYPPRADRPAASTPTPSGGRPVAGGSGTSPSADKQPEKPAAAEGLAPLALAGLPSYSLASIDNLSIAGTVPTQFANFLAAIGWRETTSLRVEAEGVEIARLPVEDFVEAIAVTCRRPGSVFNNPRLAKPSLEVAQAELTAYANQRRKVAAEQGIKLPAEPNFHLYMLQDVYYLRGIRYIANNSEAYAMIVEAAAKSGVKDAARPPTVPTIAMNVIQPTAAGNQAAPPATSADIAALQQQIDTLRTAVSSNANIQVGGSFARATARGIEFVELFQRPLAFGYVPFDIAQFDPEQGFADFCTYANQ